MQWGLQITAHLHSTAATPCKLCAARAGTQLAKAAAAPVQQPGQCTGTGLAAGARHSICAAAGSLKRSIGLGAGATHPALLLRGQVLFRVRPASSLGSEHLQRAAVSCDPHDSGRSFIQHRKQHSGPMPRAGALPVLAGTSTRPATQAGSPVMLSPDSTAAASLTEQMSHNTLKCAREQHMRALA